MGSPDDADQRPGPDQPEGTDGAGRADGAGVPRQEAGYPKPAGPYPGQDYPGRYPGQPGGGHPSGGTPDGDYPGGGFLGEDYPGVGYGGGAPVGRLNGISVASLVCGLAQFLLWFFLLVPGFIAALLGLVLGVVALGQIRRRGEIGRGMALTGILLGGLGVVGGVALALLIGFGAGHFHTHAGY
jgi:hypothetical protein